MTGEGSYASPAAFRQALTDKLRALAKGNKWSLEQLQRQMAYDRLLERLYLTADDWIVKGATALLARDLSVRGSLDVDIYRNLSRDTAEVEVRRAARDDIGDWFRFELAGTRRSSGGLTEVRIPVTAYIGATPWARFHVDLAGDEVRMTGEPEGAPPLARVVLPNFSQHGYRVYPLVDHVADKIIATIQRYGPMRRPSTRYKDLVDLVAIVTAASVAADAQIKAIISEAGHRNIGLPGSFDIPDRALWESGYAAEADRSHLRTARTLHEALAVVRSFVDPLLDGSADGRWEPAAGRWMPPEVE